LTDVNNGIKNGDVVELCSSGPKMTASNYVPGSPQVVCVWFEGTWAAWLYDLLKPHVTKVVACGPRKNALLKSGNKNDRIDARKLADLLRPGLLSPVYHGENGIRSLKEPARSYPDFLLFSPCGQQVRTKGLRLIWSVQESTTCCGLLRSP
jgi:uncharacterized protein YodC (DUF2158 family)